MAYKMFLDDIRNPQEDGWIVARDVVEAIELMKEMGFPSAVSFDHDLGVDELGQVKPTGYDFAKYLVNHDIDNGSMPDDFTFKVHSANPVGSVNISSLLNNYLRFKKVK